MAPPGGSRRLRPACALGFLRLAAGGACQGRSAAARVQASYIPGSRRCDAATTGVRLGAISNRAKVSRNGEWRVASKADETLRSLHNKRVQSADNTNATLG